MSESAPRGRFTSYLFDLSEFLSALFAAGIFEAIHFGWNHRTVVRRYARSVLMVGILYVMTLGVIIILPVLFGSMSDDLLTSMSLNLPLTTNDYIMAGAATIATSLFTWMSAGPKPITIRKTQTVSYIY